MTEPLLTVDCVIEDDGWRDALGDVEALAARCAEAAARFEPTLRGEAVALFADDAALQDLNRRFRGFDKPTNVLSFPGRAPLLGDIALARETCLAEAAAMKIAPEAHAAHLLVHGLLHLVGHDHENDLDAALMEPLETRILEAMGIADPYAAQLGETAGAAD